MKIFCLRPVSDFGNLWPGGEFNEYYNSFWGQLDYALVRYMLHLCENRDLTTRLNISFGDTNHMGLYLCHWAYSPFVDYKL